MCIRDSAEYDALMNELKRIEAAHPELLTPDSPTQRVGGKPAEGFQKVRHSRAMLSLDNAYNAEELTDWDRRVHELAGNLPVEYTAELKLDGLSAAIRYEEMCIRDSLMPEHVHILVSEPIRSSLSVVLQVLKQQTSHILKTRGAVHFWQRRYYDFNVYNEKKRVEKLRYICLLYTSRCV